MSANCQCRTTKQMQHLSNCILAVSLFFNQFLVRLYRYTNHKDPDVNLTEELNVKNLRFRRKSRKITPHLQKKKKRRRKISSKPPYLAAPVQTHMNSTPKDSVTGWPCFGLCYQRGQQQWGWVWRRPLLWGSVRFHASAWHERRDGKVISVRGRVPLCGPVVRLLVINSQHPVHLLGGSHPVWRLRSASPHQSNRMWQVFFPPAVSRFTWRGVFLSCLPSHLIREIGNLMAYMQLRRRAPLYEMFSAWDP